MTPNITGTNFVIAVSDLQASAAFYRDVLGFAVRSIPDPGWLFFTCGDCTIMAGECPDALPAAELGDHSYFAHLRVENIDEYHAAVYAAGARLTGRIYGITDVRWQIPRRRNDQTWKRRCFLGDSSRPRPCQQHCSTNQQEDSREFFHCWREMLMIQRLTMK